MRFQYDGQDLIAEYNASNALQRRFVHGPGTDNPILWYEGTGLSDKRYLTADERGSVVAISNASGTVTNVNTYDEYGNPGIGNSGRFGYTGQTWLPDLGQWYYKARIYNPALGRFMQTDPIGYGDGMNWMNYVGGDPVNFTDPTGMKCNDPRDPGAYCDPKNPELDGPEIVASGNRGIGGTSSGGVSIWARGGSILSGDSGVDLGGVGDAEIIVLASNEHTKNKRASTKGKHERGNTRRGKDAGKEKGDDKRRPPRKRPSDWKGGPYPPRAFPPLFIPLWMLDPCVPSTSYRPAGCGPMIA